VIFDLDDTLIETSKCITPLVLTAAFEEMRRAGLMAPEHAVEDLLAINETALTARDALRVFTSLYPQKETFFKIGVDALSRPLEEKCLVEPVPHALFVLDRLAKHHKLALVTRGEEILQFKKMEKAGIQPKKFSKLIVSRASTKKGDYKAVLDHLGYLPEDGAVCGDRVPLDLSPAKELGLYTVHFRNGRGLYHDQPKESVDATIDCLTELEEVLAKHEV